VSSNQASRNGAGRANSISERLAGLLRTIGASAIALALCASAPAGVLAQSASDSPGAAAAQSALPVALGASIRKTPGAAATGGAPAAADNTGAASAVAAPATGDAAATASSTAPGAMESAGVPAALSTPSAHAKGKTGTKTKTRTRTSHGAGSSNATQSASAKTDSNDTNADSQGAKDSKGKDSPFSSLQFSGNKGPIDIKSDALDLDYKGNVVTFRGHVHAAQADALLTSDTLTVTYGKDFHEVKEMVANDNVRMSQGTRWATGDHAVLDQAKHTVTLTGSPVVHDGEDQVTGSKITVHLDTGKSVVEGARAVFFPKEQKTRDNKTTAVAKSPNKTTVAKSP
jgi:lipopolysaccharide export system protein LptA